MPSDARTYWLYFAQKDRKQDAAFRALARLSPSKRRKTLMRWVLIGRDRDRRAMARPGKLAPPTVPAPVPDDTDGDYMVGIRRAAPQSETRLRETPPDGRKDPRS